MLEQRKFSEIQGSGAVRRIALENQFSAPVDRVWEAVTQVEHLCHWWPDWRPGGEIEPWEGGRVVLGDGSWIQGSVKVWAPPRIFEFSWRDVDTDPQEETWFDPETRSLLRIDLVEAGDEGTLLHLVQFCPAASAPGGSAGWHHFAGERLATYLDEGEVIDRPGRFDEIEKLYAHDV